jgi:hypothetical protein
MQQTLPRTQEPLGRPPNNEQMFPGAQIPASPLGDLQASKEEMGFSKLGLMVMGDRSARLENGRHVLAGVNRLLKRPVLIREAFRPVMPKRPSGWPFLSYSSLSIEIRIKIIN